MNLLKHSQYSKKELASMYQLSIPTLVKKIEYTPRLKKELEKLGYKKFRRYSRRMVILIFQSMGAPNGYEEYDRFEKNNN